MRTCLLITTMNRSDLLRHSLARLTQLTLPDEILVVDDGGADDCEAVCSEAHAMFGLPVRYLYNHNPGISICSFARNVGIRNTDAEVIITSEPELIFVTDVIAQMDSAHRQNPGCVISAGIVYRARSANVMDPASCEKLVGWVAPFTARYERSWLMDIGGWDEGFPANYGQDDTDLLTRLRLYGHNQIIDQSIEVLHQWHPPTMGAGQVANGHYFDGKSFHRGDSTDIIANRGKEWGLVRERSH